MDIMLYPFSAEDLTLFVRSVLSRYGFTVLNEDDKQLTRRGISHILVRYENNQQGVFRNDLIKIRDETGINFFFKKKD